MIIKSKIPKNPIGIFDSGIGGLSVAKSIIDILPNEDIVYFGDTAHLPYGDKSKELIKSYAANISSFLLSQFQCKCIVIACNTASAAAYTFLKDKYLDHLPVINVIDPIIETIVNNNLIHKVGIIATNTTIESGVYQEKLKRRKPGIEVAALATPLLAPMIEEGFYNHKISKAIIENYLNHQSLQNIDALILGCTHYVMIKNEIAQHFPNDFTLYDSTDIVAQKLRSILDFEKLLNNKQESGKKTFIVSDITQAFSHAAEMFYGKEIELQKININANKNF